MSTVTNLLNNLNRIGAVYAEEGLKKMRIDLGENTKITLETTTDRTNAVGLKAIITHLNSFFNLDAQQFRETLADNVMYSFQRMKDGSGEGDITVVEGKEHVYEHLKKVFFDITSDFHIHSLTITVDGLIARTHCKVEEDKVIANEKARYRMDCQERYIFTESGHLYEMHSRNSLERV